MHENREISCTSWLTDQDRSAKAINRTADVNVQEKSDCAVVPVNQPNKEGQPSAEAGEEGHRLRRTSFNLTCARHRAENACPRDCTVCGKQTLPLLILGRAVCVNAPVRICAGGAISDGRPYRDSNLRPFVWAGRIV